MLQNISSPETLTTDYKDETPSPRVGGTSALNLKRAMANRSSELSERERRLRQLLETMGMRALLLKRQANFAWMTCGGLNQVGIATELGAASLLITDSAKYLVANNIESPRMIHEEGLENLGFSVKTFPWHEDREVAIVKELTGGGPLGNDTPFANAEVMPEEIARLRYALTPEEVERFRWLGARAAAIENTLLEARSKEKESEVVGRLCQELWKDRIDPVGLMVAAAFLRGRRSLGR